MSKIIYTNKTIVSGSRTNGGESKNAGPSAQHKDQKFAGVVALTIRQGLSKGLRNLWGNSLLK